MPFDMKVKCKYADDCTMFGYLDRCPVCKHNKAKQRSKSYFEEVEG